MKMKIEETIVVEINDEDLIRHPYIQEICTWSYHNKDGCPNVNKGSYPPYIVDKAYLSPCFPHAEFIDDFTKPPYVIVAVKCNMEDYLSRMRDEHKDWSDRKLRNVIWWQEHIRAELRKLTKYVIRKYPGTAYLTKPEAHGVNVFQTMKRLGYILEKIPTRYVYKVNLIVGLKKVRQKKLPFA